MKVSLFIVPLALGALLAGAALAAGWPPPLAPQAAHRTPVHRTVSRRAKCPPVRHRAERHVAARHRVEHRRYAEARSQPSQRPCPRHHFVASSKSLRHHQEFAFHGVTSWPTQGREEWRQGPWLAQRGIGPGAPLPPPPPPGLARHFAGGPAPALFCPPPSREGPPPPPMGLQRMAPPPRFAMGRAAQNDERFVRRGFGEGVMAEQGRREARVWRFQRQQGGPVLIWRGPDAPPWAHGEDDRRAGRWRLNRGGGYEVWRTTGRDDQGYLIWPGKPMTDRSPGW